MLRSEGYPLVLVLDDLSDVPPALFTDYSHITKYKWLRVLVFVDGSWATDCIVWADYTPDFYELLAEL